MLVTVANNFVTDKNSGEVMTVGYVECTWGQSVFIMYQCYTVPHNMYQCYNVTLWVWPLESGFSGGFVISCILKGDSERVRILKRELDKNTCADYIFVMFYSFILM